MFSSQSLCLTPVWPGLWVTAQGPTHSQQPDLACPHGLQALWGLLGPPEALGAWLSTSWPLWVCRLSVPVHFCPPPLALRRV